MAWPPKVPLQSTNLDDMINVFKLFASIAFNLGLPNVIYSP